MGFCKGISATTIIRVNYIVRFYLKMHVVLSLSFFNFSWHSSKHEKGGYSTSKLLMELIVEESSAMAEEFNNSLVAAPASIAVRSYKYLTWFSQC